MDAAERLSVLCCTPADQVKTFAEAMIPELDQIEVLTSRTGLIMLPMRDHVQGEAFHLGEVLVSEAHVRLNDVEGYAVCLGRDRQQSLAVALIDAAWSAGYAQQSIAAFVLNAQQTFLNADQTLLRQVAATRVNMETF
ncbi:MAG: phosphonate C-P lyase system protein PhnG [Chloroflexaceae bacterium]|nr:phosphonate C-P lyase system protein PhnG [Chloroflexaceae bacterium]